MSEADLLAVARSVAGAAQDGEQIEAYAVRSRDVDVKVFGGEVESLAVAEIEGVGIRVIAGQRQGYAWAGSLDADVIADTLADARDNAGFGSPDEFYGLADPSEFAGVPAVELDLWRDELLAVPTAEKVALAIELDAATRAIDSRVRGVESATYGDAAVESAVATSRGVEVSNRRTMCSCSAYAMAGEGVDTRTGSGFSAARSFAELDPEKAARDAAERAVRLLGARQPESCRLPVVLDPLVTRSIVALVGGALSGEAVQRGRSLFVGREGETVAAVGVTLIDDPTIVGVVRGGVPRCRRAPDAPPRADRRRGARRLPAQHVHRTARRHREHRVGGARRLQVASRSRCPRAAPAARDTVP